MSKAQELADELTQIARYPTVRINAIDPVIQKEAATLLRTQDALMRQALGALGALESVAGKGKLCNAAIAAINEHLK